MSIVKRQNSKNWFSEFTLNGKRYIKSTKTSNRTLASKIDQKYYQDAVEEQALGGNHITLKAALLQYQKTKRDNIAHNKSIGRIIQFIEEKMDINTPLHKVDNRFLQQFVDLRFDLDLKPGTVRSNLLVLSGCINLMDKLGYDICPKLQYPTVTVKPTKLRVLTLDEEQKLLNELLPRTSGRGNGIHKQEKQMRLYILVVMLLDLGCRHNEVIKLKWEQCDFKNKVIHLYRSKTSSSSILPMSDRVYDLLVNVKRANKVNEYLFPSEDGTTHMVYNRGPFSKACQRAGLDDVVIHTLRHTALSRLAMAGLQTHKLMLISGHSDQKSLSRYIHLTSGDVVEEARTLINR